MGRFPSPLWGGWARRSLERVGVKPQRARERLMISAPPVGCTDTLPIKGRELER